MVLLRGRGGRLLRKDRQRTTARDGRKCRTTRAYLPQQRNSPGFAPSVKEGTQRRSGTADPLRNCCLASFQNRTEPTKQFAPNAEHPSTHTEASVQHPRTALQKLSEMLKSSPSYPVLHKDGQQGTPEILSDHPFAPQLSLSMLTQRQRGPLAEKKKAGPCHLLLAVGRLAVRREFDAGGHLLVSDNADLRTEGEGRRFCEIFRDREDVLPTAC